ncbi:MAG: hypothetical protein AAGF74_00450 [Pseudomonadota bacterium]
MTTFRSEDGALTYAHATSRCRFDVAVTRPFPVAEPGRLARQIRQDVWRACQRQRGFSPIVRLAPAATGWTVTAGAQIDAVFPERHVESIIAGVLDDPKNRTRWLRFARPSGHV